MNSVFYSVCVTKPFPIKSLAFAFMCFALACPVALRGQVPLLNAAESASAGINCDWKVDAARTALESGLSATAADIYASLFKAPGFSEQDRATIALDFSAALIARSKFDEASGILQNTPGVDDKNRLNLYRAVIQYGLNSASASDLIRKQLVDVKQDSLSGMDMPWYFLLQGLLADAEGNTLLAERYFESAENAATSSMQSALFSSLILRQRMLSSPTDENLLVEIREQFEALAGQSAAFPFLREYVVLLYGLGKNAEAIRILESELASVGAGYTIEERTELLLLKGLILGLDSTAGWSSLKELVRAGIDSESTMIALQLLGSAKGREAELMALLSEIISRPEPHPMLAQLYYMRCQLALANPETTALAEADARYLLEQFPGLSEITSVYRLLAYAALRRDPPRYRVAADYLLELRDQSADPAELADLNRLIGDCYFMNRDYANAVDFYESVKAAVEVDAASRRMLLRLVLSLIRSDRVEAAVAVIDQADFAGRIDDADRWRAEWSIALSLQARGQVELALERVRLLIEQDTSPVPAALDLRLRWLEAHLGLQLNDAAGVAGNLDALLTRMNSMPEDALGAKESSLLKSELLLLKAKALIASDQGEAALEVIAKIRSEFQQRAAAERTYFTESAYHVALGDFRSAQESLELFARDYPESSLVPRALFEAALHCQRQGPEQYGEAVILLDRLVSDYPESNLVYHSSLKQGDLLRLMNDFAGAQLIYENLINRFPAHRLRYATELSLADCIAALAQGDSSQLAEATSILERLVDRPDLPAEVQIEAGYKWGSILTRNQDEATARTVYGLVTSRFLLDPQNAAELTPVGRYWLSRTIFSLSDLLERIDEPAEAERLYRKLVAFNLPGRGIALTRISQLQLAETP